MTIQPKVSVIIPVFSHDHLSFCLRSVSTQTLKELEIICICDRSDNNGRAIINSFAKWDNRFVIITQDHADTAAFRNAGLNKSYGEFVCFMDTDGYYPDMYVLESLYEKALQNNVDICGGNFNHAQNGPIGAELADTDHGIVFENEGIVDYANYQFDEGLHRFIYKRAMLLENNITFQPYAQTQEDVFLVRTMLQAKHFYALNKAVYNQNGNPNESHCSLPQVDNTLQGFTELLTLSKKHKLAKLHAAVYKKLSVFLNKYYSTLEVNISELMPYLIQIHKSLDPKYLNNSECAFLYDPLIRLLSNPAEQGNHMEKTDNAPPPKISVIVPIHNKEKFLHRTLDSLINQSLKEIEIICVDDYSSDRSREIIDEYASRDHRIVKIYHAQNLSTSQSRKDGVLASHGQYIMFLDGDDTFKPNACKVAYNAITTANTDIVHFGVEINNCSGVPEERIQMNKRLCAPYIGKLKENLINACWKDRKFGFQIWNKIYKGNLVRKAFELVEDGQYPKAQDLYAFFIIAFYARTYTGITEELYEYNFGLGVTGQDIMNLAQYRTLVSEKYVADALERFRNKNNLSNEYAVIIKQIYNHFLAECANRWRDNISELDRVDAFDELVSTFGLEDVICYFAQSDWAPENRLCEKFLCLHPFQYVRRPEGKKLTVAMYYRNIVNGGAQRVAAMLCNRWADQQDEDGNDLYNVVLITDEHKLENEYQLSEKVKRAYLPSWETAKKENFRARFQAWQRVLQDYSIDIVVHGLWVADTTWWDMLAIKGTPTHPAYVCHSHNFCAVPYEFGHSGYKALIYRYMICDGVVTLSECDNTFVSAFNKNARYILNPIAFSPSERSNSVYEPNTIVWTGRISPEKNPLDTLKALKLIRKNVPDVQMYIVGDGSEHIKEQMYQYIEQNDLSSNVHLEGFTLDVDKYYRKASVFIMTSKYEGFSLTISEALSFGVPVVTYDMPWLTFFQDGRGIIAVPQSHYEMLAQKIIKLLTTPNLIREIGTQGKQLITEIANADIMSDWKEFFSQVNEDSRSASESHKHNNIEIILKYLTLYQFDGRQKIVNSLQQAKSTENRLKKELEQNIIQLTTVQNELKQERQKFEELKQNLRKADSQLNDATILLRNIRRGSSFKIGRLLTWLPRKLTGRHW